jgi:Family of unknown function (DUF6152)
MQRVSKILFLGIFSAAVLSSTTAQAHHSASMFDFSKCDSITGTVKKLEWVYPHSWLWVVVPKSDGTEDAWGFEFMSPVQAMGLDKRWKKDVIKKGDKVVVKFSPHRDGQHAGALSSVQIPDGYTLPGTPGLCGTAPR